MKYKVEIEVPLLSNLHFAFEDFCCQAQYQSMHVWAVTPESNILKNLTVSSLYRNRLFLCTLDSLFATHCQEFSRIFFLKWTFSQCGLFIMQSNDSSVFFGVESKISEANILNPRQMKQKLVCLDVKRGCFSNINEYNAKHICSLLFCKYTLHFASVNPLFSILNHTCCLLYFLGIGWMCCWKV